MNEQGKRALNRLKRKLQNGEPCYGATLTINSPISAEILSHVDLDWLWFEMEHTSLTLENVLTMQQATNGSNVSTIVRVPWNDKTMIKRALDTGPDGIIIPLVNTKEEAEYAVRAMKYPPVGERGAGLSRAQGYGLAMGDYLSTANDEVMTILMIEHIEAVKNINEILAVPGVDSIMVGALDLSGSMGILGQTNDASVEAAIQSVLQAAKKAKKPAGIITVTPEDTKRRVAEGFTNLIIGIDVLFLIGGVTAALKAIKG